MPDNGAAWCGRCGAILYPDPRGRGHVALHLAVAAAVLFAISNVLPFMSLSLGGRVVENRLITGVIALHQQQSYLLASLVLVAIVIAPAVRLVALVYVLSPRWAGQRSPSRRLAARVVYLFREWSMLDVLLLGVLVAIIKLSHMASIELEAAFYTFAAAVVLLAWTSSQLSSEVLWARRGTVDVRRMHR